MTSPPEPNPWTYSPVPAKAQRLFRMCWQLENWLRTMVYVELRSDRADWETPIRSTVKEWPPPYLTRDKRLHHMATPHQAGLSYLTFPQLWEVISDQWRLFERYFPPKDIVDGRIAEVKAIRNRVAHFREPHPNDLARMELFLKDMEAGIRQLCIRYTVPKMPGSDPVMDALKEVWGRVGYGIELLGPRHDWLYASGRHRMQPLMNANLDLLAHHHYSAASPQGVIYRVTLQRGNQSDWPIDTVDIFNRTKGLHDEIIHFIICSTYDIHVTIPAIHGAERTAELVAAFLQVAMEASRGSPTAAMDRERLEWPEYVLWPDHMLTFFSQEMRESVLQLD